MIFNTKLTFAVFLDVYFFKNVVGQRWGVHSSSTHGLLFKIHIRYLFHLAAEKVIITFFFLPLCFEMLENCLLASKLRQSNSSQWIIGIDIMSLPVREHLSVETGLTGARFPNAWLSVPGSGYSVSLGPEVEHVVEQRSQSTQDEHVEWTRRGALFSDSEILGCLLLLY